MKHSIRTRFTVIFLTLITIIIATTIAANTFGLETYYRSEKIKNLSTAYDLINTTVQDAVDSNTTIISENGTDNEVTEKLANILKEYSDKYNVTIAIVDSVTDKAIISSERDGDFLLQRAQEYIFDKNKDNDKNSHTLVENDDYSIISHFMKSDHSSFIELMGYCNDNQTMLLMSTPMANLKESVVLANTFLIYVGIIAFIVSLLIVLITTRKIAGPIKKLATLSDRMGQLDFSVRYDDNNDDEIGVLGKNMNRMADQLEEAFNELNKANSQLHADIKKKEEIDEMRKDFIANVSHELKTPIALVQGYAEGLNDGLCEDEESRKYYSSVIVDEANKMNLMVKQLLNLSALESGTNELDFEEFNITELIKGVISATQILITDKKAKIIFDDRKPVYVIGDEFKIEEVATNFISNAIHHVSEKGEIRITVESKEKSVIINVFNTGKQIPEGELNHIWEKFYKVDKAHSRIYGGTGIGLSIVKAVMDAHDMECGVYNENEGVNFWFSLKTKKYKKI